MFILFSNFSTFEKYDVTQDYNDRHMKVLLTIICCNRTETCWTSQLSTIFPAHMETAGNWIELNWSHINHLWSSSLWSIKVKTISVWTSLSPAGGGTIMYSEVASEWPVVSHGRQCGLLSVQLRQMAILIIHGRQALCHITTVIV